MLITPLSVTHTRRFFMHGNNVAGWTNQQGWNCVKFESGQITLTGDSGGRCGIVTSKAYNFAPYTWIGVETINVYGYNSRIAPTANIHRGREFYNPGPYPDGKINVIATINLTNGQTYGHHTFDFNISAYKITDYIAFSLQAYTANYSGVTRGVIYRIWFH